jgi:Xaa-Pro aminopeptidase
MAFLDRQRAERLMRESGLDALVLFGPENFTYAVGAPPGVAAMWRRAGAAIAIVPIDARARTVAVVGDLVGQAVRTAAPDVDVREHRLWVDTVDVTGLSAERHATREILAKAYRRQNGGSDVFLPRPQTFDLVAVLRQLEDILGESGLSHGRIGVDLEFLPAADHAELTRLLPGVDWVDGSAVVRRLRAIKSAGEIALLRRASAYAEAGLVAMRDGIARGQSRKDLSRRWREAAAAAAHGADDLTGVWDFIAVGRDPWGRDGVVADHAVIKADVGTIVGGYSSDGARTFVVGEPDPLARDVYAVLADAFAAGIDAIRPGALLRDVYAATAAVFRRALPGYGRGHFGHGVGASVGSEEWPFISAESDVTIEPGMVLAFETPFYGNGIGALMIEDQLLVTDAGIEVMNTLPRELVRL